MKTELTNPSITAGQNVSYWTASTQPIQYGKLNNDVETDVVIIGGGLAGVTTAYCLTKAGKSVVLVEDGFIGSGETGRTTAHITAALDDRYYELERMFGNDDTKLVAESHTAAINFIEKTVQELQIDCSFQRVDGYLFLHPTDKEENLDKEFDAAVKAGLNVDMLHEVPHLKKSVGRCIRFKNQAQFHPMPYLEALCNFVTGNGGRIYTETKATDIDNEGIKSENGYQIKARHVVVATNSPINNKFVMHTKQYPYRTYVLGATIKKGSLPASLWWDTGDQNENNDMPPYHYVRVQPHNQTHDILILGGEDHSTGLAETEGQKEEDRYKRLEEWATQYFDFDEIVYRWSGQVLEPMDSLAYIGRNPMDKDNIYIVTGDSGNGITHTTIAGMLLTDLITGKPNPWENIYSPSRFKLLAAGGTFLRELFGMVKEYYQSYPSQASKLKLSEIPKNNAALVEIDNTLCGVYRNDADQLQVVLATCTHLGCSVRWNNDEKSWDCPCHGSRFTVEGKVINGPATADLTYYKENDSSYIH